MPKKIFLLLIIFASAVTSARDKTENWLEVRSPHFVVLSDSSEKQARHVADQFERMRFVFHTVLLHGIADPGTPIVVLAVKDKKDFQALEPEAYLEKGQIELAGLFLRARTRTTFYCDSMLRASIPTPRFITNTRICFRAGTRSGCHFGSMRDWPSSIKTRK